MPDPVSVSLVDVGKLAVPVDTFIKKVSDAVGCVYAPFHKVRMAEAESEALYVKAQGEIAANGLKERARLSAEAEQIRHQQNIEQITRKAVPLISSGAEPQKLAGDWLTHFFSKARTVSDDDMQLLWAKILSGEANTSGSYSKRTLNLLAELDKGEAEAFAKLCSFCVRFGASLSWPIVFQAKENIYKSQGLNFSDLIELETIGMIQHSSAGYMLNNQPKHVKVTYFEESIELVMPADEKTNELNLGSVVFTKIGRELAPICASKPVPGFTDYLREKWKEHIPKKVEETA